MSSLLLWILLTARLFAGRCRLSKHKTHWKKKKIGVDYRLLCRPKKQLNSDTGILSIEYLSARLVRSFYKLVEVKDTCQIVQQFSFVSPFCETKREIFILKLLI